MSNVSNAKSKKLNEQRSGGLWEHFSGETSCSKFSVSEQSRCGFERWFAAFSGPLSEVLDQ